MPANKQSQAEVEQYLYNEYIRYHSPALAKVMVAMRLNECRGVKINPTAYKYVEIARIVNGKVERYFAWSPRTAEEMHNATSAFK